MNYRIVRQDGSLTFREVYQDEAGEVIGIGGSAAPFGESVRELVIDLDKMLRACALPVLEIPEKT